MADEPRLYRENVGCRRFDGKNILVTAGTLGIGRAIVERLCQEGAHVFLCSRKEKNVSQTVQELKSKGFKVDGTTCNVGKVDELKNFVDSALSVFQSEEIHGVVMNAAVNPMAGGTLDVPSEVYEKVMSINVQSNFELVKIVRPYLPFGASLVLISSTGAFNPSPPLGIYTVSKTAMVSLGRVLSHDLGPDGIRVNGIAPGLTKTKFSRMLWEGSNGEQMLNQQSLPRLAEPEDMAGAAAFLLSQDSAMMTGETIVISGGTRTRL